MFKIKYKKLTGRSGFVRDKAGKIRKFTKRQQARQYIRNHLLNEPEIIPIYFEGIKNESRSK